MIARVIVKADGTRMLDPEESAKFTPEMRRKIEENLNRAVDELEGSKAGSVTPSNLAPFRQSLRDSVQPSESGARILGNPFPHKSRTTELEIELARKKAEIESLHGQISILKRETESVPNIQQKLDQTLAVTRNMDNSLREAKERYEIERSQHEDAKRQIAFLSKNIENIVSQSAGKLKLDESGRNLVTPAEIDMKRKMEESVHRLKVLELQRDRLFVENFEMRRELGKPMISDNLSEQDIALRLVNVAQTAELETNKHRRKIATLEDELRLLRAELNAFRGVENGESRNSRGELIRTN